MVFKTKKYLCRKRHSSTIISFSEEPTYDYLFDYWSGAGYRILPFAESKPHLSTITFENSPYVIDIYIAYNNRTSECRTEEFDNFLSALKWAKD